jgi:hypothetical protein
VYICSNKQTKKKLKTNIMEDTEITTMRDIIEIAMLRLKIERNTEALYDMAIRLTNDTDSFTFDYDDNKDILNTLETILKENGFSPLDMNCTKFSSINIITIRLATVVR